MVGGFAGEPVSEPWTGETWFIDWLRLEHINHVLDGEVDKRNPLGVIHTFCISEDSRDDVFTSSSWSWCPPTQPGSPLCHFREYSERP